MRVFAVLSVLFIGLVLTEQTLAHGLLGRVRDRIRSGYDFARQAGQGTRDMYRAYSDMREANWRNSDQYFHARGNHDAASRGPGGRWAARVIS